MVILKTNKKVICFIFDLTDLSTNAKVCTVKKARLSLDSVSQSKSFFINSNKQRKLYYLINIRLLVYVVFQG